MRSCKDCHAFTVLATISSLSQVSWSGNISTLPIIQAGAGNGTVTFECNYTLDGNERVYPGSIVWKVEIIRGLGTYEEIATFSPPDFPGEINSFSLTESGMMFMNRSELLNVTTIGPKSFHVAMRVTELKCSDERKYRCVVNARSTGGSPPLQSDTSLLFRSQADTPYGPFGDVPRDMEEGMLYNFSCTADVGNPPGKIKWWRFSQGTSRPDFMGESASQHGVCVHNVTSFIEHNMTKEDHDSVWRCSVDNDLLTTSPDYNKPYQDSQKINVFYRVGIPIISKEPDYSEYLNGSMVVLHCTAQGNPRPNGNSNDTINKYVWTFQGQNSTNVTELSAVNGTLFLLNVQENDSGVYECVACNGFNGKSFNASQNIDLRIVQPEAETQNSVKPEAETHNSVVVICMSVVGGLVLVAVLVILVIKRHRLPCLCRCSKTSPL